MNKPVEGYPYTEVLRAGLATPAEQADVAQLLTTQAAEIKRLQASHLDCTKRCAKALTENKRLTERVAEFETIGTNPVRYAGLYKSQLREQAAEIKRLTDAIQNYLDGNYPNPRTNRPNPCLHGIMYYEECESCNVEHFEAALKQESGNVEG